jgi:hypothetical protein
MTVDPVLPWFVLGLLAVAALAGRLFALRRIAFRGWPLLRWTLLTIAVLAVLVAATRPGVENDDAATGSGAVTRGAGLNVFVLLDRSVGAASFARMRDDTTALIDRYPAARFAVVGFAARPALEWPLSDDVWSLRPVVAGTEPDDPSPDAASQVNASAAATILRYQLIAAAQQYPGSKNLVFYLGAGAPGSRAPQGA